MAKIVPAQTRFRVTVPHAGGVNVDIAHCLSIINRRMYRQGMNYYVENVQMVATAGAIAAVHTASDTWVTHNAWKKGYETWRSMQNEANDGDGARLKGKWADFKVLLDDIGLSFVTPIDGDNASYLTGEWHYSNFVYDDAGTARSPAISLIGSVAEDSHIGLIEAYGNARNYPTSGPANPAEIQTGFYAQYHGVGDIDDELMVDVRDDNDTPPYDTDDYPGGANNADAPMVQAAMAATATYPISNSGGFLAPCGLLRIIQNQTSGSAVAYFIITVGVGPYKGVMASRMGQ